MQKSVWTGGHTEPVLALDQSKERVLASGGGDGLVALWSADGNSQTKFSVTNGDSLDVTCVCFCCKEAKHLYVSCGKKISLYDIRNSAAAVWEVEHKKDEINQITLNDKSKFLAACDDAGEIQILELPNAKLFKTLSRRHTDMCCSVQFRPQRPWELISGGMDYSIVQWDFAAGRPLCHVSTQELSTEVQAEEESALYTVNPPFVNSIHVASNSRTFACGLGNGNIELFHFEGKKKFCHDYRLKAHSQGVSQVHFPRFQPNELLLSGGNDCKLVLWHQSREEINGSSELTNGASSMAHGPPSSSQPMTVAHEIAHGAKVNWLCSSNLSANLIFVADCTNNISVYETQH